MGCAAMRAPLQVIREDELYDTDFNAAHNIKLESRIFSSPIITLESIYAMFKSRSAIN